MEVRFEEHLKKYLPEDEINNLMEALSSEQGYSCIIIDNEKISSEKILEIYPTLIPHPIVNNAYLFKKNELELGKSLLFEIGAFYILEPCSPLVSHFLNITENDFVLDRIFMT